MLLLMAMWNAGGKLPADDAKLARVVRMSVKKWRAISADLMGYFESDDDHIWHNRLTKELQKSEAKSQSRAAAGAKGGAAKSLKNNDADVANAKQMPKHLPDTITSDTSSLRSEASAARARSKEDYDLIEAECRKAAGLASNPSPRLLDLSPILGLIDAGYDLRADILPPMRAKPNPRASAWTYFVPQIQEAAERRSAVSSVSKPAARETDWQSWCAAFFASGTWNNTLGPRPGEPGCKAPADVIASAQAANERMRA